MDFIKKITPVFIFLVISVLFIFCFSFSTSPLYDYFGYDSGIFMLVGKAVASGKVMYVDIFDHKGPVLFFIEALMMKIGGVTALFIFQIINLTFILYIIYRICLLFSFPKKYLFIPIGFIIVLLACFFEGGNLTEEYSLTFLLICLWLGCKYILSPEEKHPPKYAFVYGAVFTIVAFIRLTNNAGLSGMIAAIVIFLLYNKEWKNLLQNIGTFILGGLLAGLLICSYFFINDAFDEMIYATFTFNFKYAETFSNSFRWSLKDIIYQIRVWGPNVFVLFTLLFYSVYNKEKNFKLILIVALMTIFTGIALNMGLRTDHYMMLNVLPSLLGTILFVKVLVDKKINVSVKVFLTIIILALSLYFAKKTLKIKMVYESNRNHTGWFYYDLDKDLVKRLIPVEDRDSVFGYNLMSNWYLETNILPPFRFYTSQEIWARTDSLVYDETNKYLETTPPKWIVIPNPELATSTRGVNSNPVLGRILESDYELKGEDSNHKYYKRKR